jgi:hypothetical protein
MQKNSITELIILTLTTFVKGFLEIPRDFLKVSAEIVSNLGMA